MKKFLKSHNLRPFSSNTKDWSKSRSLDLSSKPAAFDMKYFITRTTILQVYRESLKLCYRIPDKQMRETMLEMMKDEFRPFRLAR